MSNDTYPMPEGVDRWDPKTWPTYTDADRARVLEVADELGESGVGQCTDGADWDRITNAIEDRLCLGLPTTWDDPVYAAIKISQGAPRGRAVIASLVDALQDEGRAVWIAGWSDDGGHALVVDDDNRQVTVAASGSTTLGRWECSTAPRHAYAGLYARRFPLRS